MTGRPPLLIVTLPARSIPALKDEIGRAQAAGADLAEVRIDRLSSEEEERLGSLFPTSLPLLVTLRSRAEGGEGPDDPRTRADRLLAAGRLPFAWTDLEYDRDRDLVARLDRREGLIVSTHLAAATDGAELGRRLRQSPPEGAVRKVVLPASVGALFSRVLPELPPPGELSLAVATTVAHWP